MTLHKQAASLMVLHAADVLQPLIILPFAGNILGASGFGQYAYALALTQLASVTVDYGFYFTARRNAASVRNDPRAVQILFAEVIAAKAILFLGVCLVTLAMMVVSDAITIPVSACIIVAALGSMVLPYWLFSALEKPWQSAICTVASRSLALLAFFVLVRSPSDAYLAASIQAAIPLASAVISIPFVVGIGLDGFRSLALRRVLKQLQDGWSAFLSTAAYTAAAALPVPMVQHFSGFTAAGHYSVAEKLISAVRPIFRVMGETLMPRIAYLAAHDPAKGLVLIVRSLWTILIGAALSLTLYFAGPYAVLLMFGPGFADSTPLIHVLSIVPLCYNVSMCLAQFYMFNYGHEKAWTWLIVSGLLSFISTAYLLSYWLDGAMAVAIGFVFGESVVAMISIGYFIASVVARGRAADISKHSPIYGGLHAQDRRS
jgi:O-antigen/teichoic acid export membrane protein